MLSYYVYIAKKRTVREIDVKRLMDTDISHEEMRELDQLERNDLLQLMNFCDIRVYNEMPVIGCEENELKMAYVLWRASHIKSRNLKKSKFWNKINKIQKNILEQLSFLSILK